MPPPAIRTMLNSIAPSTMAQYECSWKIWWEFCTKNSICPLNALLPDVLAFFQSLLDSSDYSYSTFNSHRAALAFILPFDISEDPVLKRFFKGIFRSRPSGPKYDLTWDPQLVLDHLENLSCDSLKNLSHKLLVLLLLATGQRLQTISLISLDNIRENDNGLKVFITALIKTSGPKRPQPCLDLPFFKENLNLCVASLLKEYLKRTSSLRKDNSSALFISFKKPFSPVSKQTLSR